MDRLILVALSFNSAFPLGQVAGPPGAVQVMERHQAVLDVGACAHLLGAAQQDAHLAGADLGEQLLFAHLGVGLVDKGDLFGGHAFGNELLPDVLVHRKGRFRLIQRHRILQSVEGRVVQRLRHLFGGFGLGRGNVAEHQLGQLVGLAVPPDLHDGVHALVDLGARFVRQHLVDDPLVQAQLAPIRRDLEHIVHRWVHAAPVYFGRPFGEGLYHLFLDFGGLGHDVVVLHLGRGQVQLVGGFDVRDLLKEIHQLRQVEELGKACACPVAGALRGQFQRRHGLTKSGRPAVKMGHAQLLQPVILEIPLHGVKLGHGVADRCAGGKDNAPAAGDLVHVAALGEHIRRFLRVRRGEARHVAHFCVEKEVLVVVRLVHEQPVHAQLLKGHHIVLAAFRLQLFQPGLQGFLGPLQLFHREAFPAAGLHLGDALGDFPNLLMQQPLLAFLADGDFLELGVAHDDGIIVAGGDAGTKLLAVVLFKVLFGCHQDIGGRVQTQELRSPLFGQVVGHHKEGFLAQPQALGLHCGPHHFKGLARAHLVGQQRVSAVQHMGDGIFLMLPQGDGRVHAAENNVAAVILAGAGGVHFLVVLAHQRLPPLRVPPNPVLERLPDGLLLLGGQGGLLGVQHPALLAVRIFNSIVDTHIPQVEGIFEDFIGVGAAGPVGGIGRHISLSHSVFAGDLPLGGKCRVVDFNAALKVKGRVKGFVHELLNVLFVNPGCPQPHLDLGSVQVLGLGGGQSLHVDRKGRVLFRRPLGLAQLPAHVAGEVFIGGHIMGRPVRFGLARHTEDDTPQLVRQFLAGFAGELFHISHVHAGFLRDGDRQRLAGRVHGGDGLMGFDSALGEHIRLAFQPAVLVQHFQRTEQVIAAVIGKGQPVCPVVDKAIFSGEIVIAAVQFGHLRPDVGIRRGGVHLQVDELLHTVPQPHQPFDAGLGGGV